VCFFLICYTTSIDDPILLRTSLAKQYHLAISNGTDLRVDDINACLSLRSVSTRLCQQACAVSKDLLVHCTQLLHSKCTKGVTNLQVVGRLQRTAECSKESLYCITNLERLICNSTLNREVRGLKPDGERSRQSQHQSVTSPC
jgi:hypothetical protein